MFYKIIKDNKIVDVNNEFFKLQRKHNLLINTDYKHAEFICSSDGVNLYTTSWTSEPAYGNKNSQYVEAVLIDQDEYNQLKEELQLNHVVIQTIEDSPEDVVVVEPQKPERHVEVLSLRRLEERVAQLEKIIEQLLNK